MIFLFRTRPAKNAIRRTGIGSSGGSRRAGIVPAVVFTRIEPHRTTLKGHEAFRPTRSLPPDLPRLSSRHPRGSQRSANQVLPATGLVDDSEFPAIRRRLTHGRARYHTSSAGFSGWHISWLGLIAGRRTNPSDANPPARNRVVSGLWVYSCTVSALARLSPLATIPSHSPRQSVPTAPPSRMGGAGRFSHRIEKEHPQDPGILSLQSDCPNLARISGTWWDRAAIQQQL